MLGVSGATRVPALLVACPEAPPPECQGDLFAGGSGGAPSGAGRTRQASYTVLLSHGNGEDLGIIAHSLEEMAWRCGYVHLKK